METKEVISKSIFEAELLSQLLPIYYKRLFPYSYYYMWLSYGNIDKKYFINREFSFTINGDTYIRYQSFNDQSDMEKEFQKNNPDKFDIGAVFNYKPRHHKTIATFLAQEKELVFDVDMSDYDEVRTCCTGATICPKCWPFMTVAMKIVDRALREDFGYEHLLWVYSGRRGVHCWVCDESARKLSVQARSAICQYLTVIKGGALRQKKVFLPEKIHPSISSALEIIEKHFEDLMIEKQDFMSCAEDVEVITGLCSDPKLKKKIEDIIRPCRSTSERWDALKLVAENDAVASKNPHFLQEVILQMCYPRLDVNVTKGLNHLLKSPFSVHPKTGRVCVPIDMDYVEDFDPFSVPTVSQLCDELNRVDLDFESSPNGLPDELPKKRRKDFKTTSLASSVEVFQKFIQKLELTWKGKLLEDSDKKMEL